MPVSVFISHSSKDHALVRELRQALEGLQIVTWVDYERLTAGEILTTEIKANIKKADYFLAVLTLNALQSDWVQREIDHAKKQGKKIIPLTSPQVAGAMLAYIFGRENVPAHIALEDRPDALSKALPRILAALGLDLPTLVVEHAQVQAAPVADLVLELSNLAMEQIESDGNIRRATAEARLSFTSADLGRTVESKPYRIVAPLGPIEAGDLSWYLEDYFRWLSKLFDERAQKIEANLPHWGGLLFGTLNTAKATREPFDAWKSASGGERRFTVKVQRELIEGAPAAKQAEADEAATAFLSLPWELLHDGKVYLFQGQHPVRVRRSLPNDLRLTALATDPPIRVLLVSPRPEDDSAAYIDHRVSAKPLVEALSNLGPELVRFKLLEPPTYAALVEELAREPYHVVHFDGHGVWSREHGLGMLCFENAADLGKLEGRRHELIDAKKLAELVHARHVPLFFLEACQTALSEKDPSASVAGRLLESGVASVVAMTHSVLVETARRFIEVFYRELLSGKRVGQAMLAGQRTLHANAWRGKKFDDSDFHLQDWFVPVLFQEEQDPQLIRQLPGQQVREAFEQRAKMDLGKLPELSHDFVGRGRDLLKAERMLAPGYGARYLAVRGSGGEGKTTFAVELARWLVATRRYERAAFASVEQVTGAEAVIIALGQQLVAGFDTEPEEQRQKLVERALRERRTVVVIDNMESVGGALLEEVLDLCGGLGGQSGTLLIFTSREALPAPFERNEIRIGRLDRASAIALLGKLRPKDAPESRDSQEDLERLVDALGCHARSLVLIAREAGSEGVRSAAENLGPIMRSMEAKYPGSRENSLLASAELSLRRLPEDVRARIRRLAVFHGGGSVPAIALALEFQDLDQLNALLSAQVAVGLAEWITPNYVRFDPALLAATDLSDAERDDATGCWAEAMEQVAGVLYEQSFKDAALARSLTLLDLPNFVAALEHGATRWATERVVNFATRLEQSVAVVNRPKALETIQAVGTAAARLATGWSHARFLVESAAIDRLMVAGRFREALAAARAMHARAEAAGGAAAAYHLAMAKSQVGDALRKSGNDAAALPYLQDARQRFLGLTEGPMAACVALARSADCLRDLGRYEEAAIAYRQALAEAEECGARRDVAVFKGQLATVLRLQKQFEASLRLAEEAREEFEQLHEPSMVAVAWQELGIVHHVMGQSKAAEAAYRQSLEIKTRTGNKSGQASSLSELATLYGQSGRAEEAARLDRQAADIYTEVGDLRMEGVARGNLAADLQVLKRFLEARTEILRAIECKKSLGHSTEPWTSFGILAAIERAENKQAAALAARNQAIDAYLAYRRDGGEPRFDTSDAQAILAQGREAAIAAINRPDLPFFYAVEIILALGLDRRPDSVHNDLRQSNQ